MVIKKVISKNKSSNSPLVSVIMPVYNNEKYVSYAIESILFQTYNNFEFIIIDDCSTDNSWKIIQKYAKKDKRIKSFRNKKNLNIVKTRNYGFSLMSDNAKYVAIFDSDDISLPKRLEREVSYLESHRNIGVVGSHIDIIDDDNNVIGKRKYPTAINSIKKKAILFSPFAQPSVMIRVSVLKDIGYYDESFTGIPCEDYDLWFRILTKYDGINIDKSLILYRISSTQSKNTHFKRVLKKTIGLQIKWLLNMSFFNILAIPNIIVESVFLLIPTSIALWIFKKVRY